MFILMDNVEKIIVYALGGVIIVGFTCGVTLILWNGGQYYIEGAQLLAAMGCLFASILLSVVVSQCCKEEDD